MAGSQLDFLHASCVCGKSLTVDHCLSCSHGGYTIMRHNELRDITADLLQEVCSDVQVEPPLQPLSGEHCPWELQIVKMAHVWMLPLRTFGLTIDNVHSLMSESLIPLHNLTINHFRHATGNRNRRKGDIMIREFERWETGQSYHSVIRLIRCKLTFSLLPCFAQLLLTCLWGSQSSSKRIHHTNTIADLALIEGRVCQWLLLFPLLIRSELFLSSFFTALHCYS